MNTLLKKTALFAIGGLFTSVLFAQDIVPHGWHMLDKAKTGYYGISTEKAYQFVKSKKLKSKTVIVAVIDSGVDTLHEDLKSILWKNPKEIPGNGIDDDKNGYVDDIYGWNFLGGKDGKSVEQDSYEAGRVYHNFRTKYDGKDITVSELSKDEQFEYEMWKRAKEEVAGEDSKTGALELMFMEKAFKNCLKSDSILRKAMGKETYNSELLSPTNLMQKKQKLLFMHSCPEMKQQNPPTLNFWKVLVNTLTAKKRKLMQRTLLPKITERKSLATTTIISMTDSMAIMM